MVGSRGRTSTRRLPRSSRVLHYPALPAPKLKLNAQKSEVSVQTLRIRFGVRIMFRSKICKLRIRDFEIAQRILQMKQIGKSRTTLTPLGNTNRRNNHKTGSYQTYRY